MAPSILPSTSFDLAPDVSTTHSGGSDIAVSHRVHGAQQNSQTGDEKVNMTEHQDQTRWSVADWHDKMLVDRDGEKIGKLQDVYVDVETGEPQFATVKEGFIGGDLTFMPRGGIQVGPDDLQVAVTKEQVRSPTDIDARRGAVSGRRVNPPITTSSCSTHRLAHRREWPKSIPICRYLLGAASEVHGAPNSADELEPGRPFDLV
jgi:uncharacterized protein YrrD